MRWRAAFVLTALVAFGVRVAAEPPPIEEVLERAARYVAEFAGRFANVVAEERYRQDVATVQPANIVVSGGRGGTLALPSTPSTLHRELRSDFLLVTLPESDELVPFRDVFEVDRTEVRDREKRLTKLFLQSTTTAVEQAKAIAEESSRYNIGNIRRTINNPVLALSFLQGSNQARFKFTLDRPDPVVGANAWILEYREQTRPTLVRGAFDRDLPAHGHVWIDVLTGHIARIELMLQEPAVTARIVTSFQKDDHFGIDVPAEMREDYTLGNTQVSGQAKYGRFRHFDVKTEQTIKK